MKIKLIFGALLFAVLVSSCGGEDKSVPQYSTEEGINQVISDLNNEFGEGCAFTGLNMVYTPEIGTIIVADGANDFSDDKLYNKTRSMGAWQETGVTTLTIEGDAKMRDFMFSTEEMNLKSLPSLYADAVKRVSEKYKKMDTEFMAKSVFINAPDEFKDKIIVNYQIDVTPVSGGSSFMCEYTSDGQFVKMRD